MNRIIKLAFTLIWNLAIFTGGHMSACAGKHTSSTIDFNRDWTFIKCDAEWPVEFDSEERVMETVILPHTWNALDMGPGLIDPYIGSGWYKKEFFAPELKAGQRLLMEFEGVNNCHKVWITGGDAG